MPNNHSNYTFDQQGMVNCDSLWMNHLLLKSALIIMIVSVTQMRTRLKDVSVSMHRLQHIMYDTVVRAVTAAHYRSLFYFFQTI